MILKPEEARNYSCCAMDKKCEGEKCMAWQWHKVEEYNTTRFPLPPTRRITELGYCGLTRQ